MTRSNTVVRKAMLAVLTVVSLVAASVMVATPSFAAGPITATQGIEKRTIDDDGQVHPGDTFGYRIKFSCGTSIGGVSGCQDATITDLLPEWIQYVGVSSFPAAAPGTATVTQVGGRDQLALSFTAPVNVPAPATGLPLGSYEMTIQVRLAADAPWEIDHQTITNTADMTSANAAPVSDHDDIIPVVPTVLKSSASKSYSPDRNFNNPGLATTLTLHGTNETNGGVDKLIVQDPAGATPPTDATSPFHYLEFTGFGAATPPAGADAVQAQVYTAADGWTTVYSGAGPPVYPATGAPATADVYGVRLIFSSTASGGIQRGADGSAALQLTQRQNVTGIPATTVTNTVVSSVELGSASAASTPATANYDIVPYGLQVNAAKSFDADKIKAGQSSTVRLGATNSGTAPLRSLTVSEPGAATPSALAGELTFAGFANGVQWPHGATSATIVYHYADGTLSGPLMTTATDTVPAAPAGSPRVVGFDVTFASTDAAGIVPGAEAALPFTVDTVRQTPQPDHTAVPNDVDVTGVALDDPTRTAQKTASDTLDIYGDRISVDVAKVITPSQAWLLPGQQVIAQIPATVTAFPATTVNPTRVVVDDTSALSADWWNLYDATQLTQLGIPDNATLTVEYTTGGGTWTALPGATALSAPPQYQTVSIDPALSDTIVGLRFVYDAKAGSSFEPGSRFQPNITFTTRQNTRNAPVVDIRNVPTNANIPDPADPSRTIPVVQEGNCATAGAHQDPLGLDAAAAVTNPCPIVNLLPVTGTGPDLIDKTLSPVGVVERSQQSATGTLGWSTGGLTGVVQQYVTETGTSSGSPATTANLSTSFFDSFDLTSLSAITKTSDPLIRYDRIASIELFDSTTGTWSAVSVNGATSWDGATASGDTVFPGYTLTAAERATTTGVRYLMTESPNRAAALTPGALNQPAVGSGVASSTTKRPIALAFALRDVRRSNPASPVLYNELYNTATPTVVHNTVTSEACFTAFVAGACADGATDTDGADISILNGTATITPAKSWTGGPVGVPPSGTPADQYPSTRATLSVTNNGPQKVDSVSLADPAPNTGFDGSAYDVFTLTDIVSVTAPGGATDTQIVLQLAGGGTSGPYTIAQATALDATALADVVGIQATSLGRIATGNAGTLTVVADFQLRSTLRHDPAVAVSSATVPNTLYGTISDPSVEPQGSCAASTPPVTPPANTVIGCAAAQMVVENTQERTVTPGKTFLPDHEQYENENDRFTTVLSGQPGGNARSNQLVLTDTSAAFWNAYSFAGLANTSGNQFSIAAPANRVMIEVFTGGTYTVGSDNSLTVTGGAWHTVVGVAGTVWKDAAGARTALPAGNAGAPLALAGGALATYGDVQGVRLTYQRVAAGSIADPSASLQLFENPATPTLQARVLLDRRSQLITGGAVPTTLAGTNPAPGTTTAGQYPNEVTAVASGVPGNGSTVSASATDSMWFRHLPTRVKTEKGPTGVVQPGKDFTVSLTTTNTGSYPIIDPVIVDTLPLGGVTAGLPDFVFPPGVDPTDPANYTFALSGGSAPSGWNPMPVSSADVTITVVTAGTGGAPTKVQFAFPHGVALGLGQVYEITWKMRLRPGAIASQSFTNAYSVSGERAFDQCNATVAVTTSCATSATVSVQPLANLDMFQAVKADDNALGVISSTSQTCSPADADADGYFVGRCAPVTKPGLTDSWRLRFQNTGTYPLDTVSSVVYLPKPGASGIDIPSAQSMWLPKLVAQPGLRSPAAPQASLTTYYSTASPGTSLCDAVLNGGGSCPAGYWKPLDASTDLSTVTALYTVVDFAHANDRLNPGEGFDLTFQTTAPAYAVDSTVDPITWNSAKTGGTYTDSGRSNALLPFEVPVVGASLATGSLSLVKSVEGDAKSASWVPTTFTGALSCTSAGQTVPAASLPAVPTLTPGTPVTLSGIPWGASCAFAETDAGAAVSLSPATVTAASDPALVTQQTVTNRYDYASLVVKKTVTAATGFAVPTGFSFSVVCSFGGSQVLNTTFTLDNGGSRTFTGLPARSSCTVVETDARGADSTLTTVNVVSPTATPTIDQATRTATIPQLSPDATGATAQNTVSYENLYDVVGMTVTKSLQGAGAAQFGQGKTFTARVVCTFGGQTLVDTTLSLSAAGGWTGALSGLIAGSQCRVTESGLQGADAVVITPNNGTDTTVGTVTLPHTGSVSMAIQNWYLTGSLAVTKVFSGAGATTYGTADFGLRLVCVRDGQTVAIPGGGDRTVNAAAPSASYTHLPTGSSCTLTETSTGGAGATAILNASGVPLAQDATAGYTFTVVTDPAQLNVADQPQPALQVQNTFNLAKVSVAKSVQTTAVDSAGAPVPFGPFQVTLDCRFLGAQVSALEPMTQKIADGGTLTWTGLPEGAACSVTESDTAGASATTFAVTQNGVTSPAQQATSTALAPLPAVAAAAQTSVAIVNSYDVAGLTISKKVAGNAAADATGTFPVHVVCTLTDASHPAGLTVRDDTFRIGGPNALTASLTNVPLGASCAVTETDNGGATETSIATRVANSPDGATTVERTSTTVTLNAPQTSMVITNTFHKPLPATGVALSWTVPIGALLVMVLGAMLLIWRRRAE